MKKVIFLTITLCGSIVFTNKAFVDIQNLLTSSSASGIFVRFACKYLKDIVPKPLSGDLINIAKDGADQHLLLNVLSDKLFGKSEKTQITQYSGMEDATFFTTMFVGLNKIFDKYIQKTMDYVQKTDGTSIISDPWQKRIKNTILGTMTAFVCRIARQAGVSIITGKNSIES